MPLSTKLLMAPFADVETVCSGWIRENLQCCKQVGLSSSGAVCINKIYFDGCGRVSLFHVGETVGNTLTDVVQNALAPTIRLAYKIAEFVFHSTQILGSTHFSIIIAYSSGLNKK